MGRLSSAAELLVEFGHRNTALCGRVSAAAGVLIVVSLANCFFVASFAGQTAAPRPGQNSLVPQPNVID